MGIRKKFDHTLYNDNHNDCLINTLRLIPLIYNLKDGENRYAVDFRVYKGEEHLFNIEVERKVVWAGPKFPYDNVQFPERKEKFLNLDKPTLFLMFNKTYNNYLCVWDKDIKSSSKTEVKNRFVPSGELFFQVPLEKVQFNSFAKVVKELISDWP